MYVIPKLLDDVSLYYISALQQCKSSRGGMIELSDQMQHYHPVSKPPPPPQSPLLLPITLNIWIYFTRSRRVKQKPSVKVVLMCVMKWSKEMPTSDGPENGFSVDNVKTEKACAKKLV